MSGSPRDDDQALERGEVDEAREMNTESARERDDRRWIIS